MESASCDTELMKFVSDKPDYTGKGPRFKGKPAHESKWKRSIRHSGEKGTVFGVTPANVDGLSAAPRASDYRLTSEQAVLMIILPLSTSILETCVFLPCADRLIPARTAYPIGSWEPTDWPDWMVPSPQSRGPDHTNMRVPFKIHRLQSMRT